MSAEKVAPHPDQMLGDVDFDGAGFIARATEARCLRQVLVFSEAFEEWRDQGADRAGVNTAVRVPADLAEDRAGIEARAAANAAQGFPVLFAGKNFSPPVVHQHQMKFLGPVRFARAAR